MSLSRTAPRLLALAQFQQQILQCFFHRRSAFVMMRLRPPWPDFPFSPLFPHFFVHVGDLLCFGLDPLINTESPGAKLYLLITFIHG